MDKISQMLLISAGRKKKSTKDNFFCSYKRKNFFTEFFHTVFSIQQIKIQLTGIFFCSLLITLVHIHLIQPKSKQYDDNDDGDDFDEETVEKYLKKQVIY